MREIKFRAWDKNEKLMREILELHWWQKPLPELGLACFVPLETTPINSSGDFELMQYTGLKDKNGKEIYEGDIVKAFKIGYPVGEVVFSKYVTDNEQNEDIIGWCIATAGRYFALDPQSNHEVIGNIYEDKELLK